MAWDTIEFILKVGSICPFLGCIDTFWQMAKTLNIFNLYTEYLIFKF